MEDIKKVYLHIGCANRRYEGFINSDKSTKSPRGAEYKNLDAVMEISEPWPHEDESVDGIVGVAIMQQLHWRDLVFALRESHRVLKAGGVFRFGVPLLGNGKSLDYLLGWNNVNLFTYELLERVLRSYIGYRTCKLCNFRQTAVPEFAQVDNKPEQLFYIEAVK